MGDKGSANTYAYVMGTRVLSAMLTALTYLLLARMLFPSDFGIFVAVVTAASVLMALADVGLQTLALRLFATPHSREDGLRAIAWARRRIYWSAATLTLIGLVGAVCFDLPWWVLGVPLWQALEKQNNGALGLLMADGKAHIQLLSISVVRILTLVPLTTPMMKQTGVLGFIMFATVASALGLLVSKRNLPIYPSRVGPPSKALRLRSFHLWVASVAAQVRQLDVVILGLIAGPLQAGLYSLPARLSAPARLVSTVAAHVAIPAASRQNKAELTSLHRIMSLTSLAAGVCLLMVAILSEELVVTLAGEAYSAAAKPLAVLSVGLILSIPGGYISGLLQGAGHERPIAKLGVVLSIVSLALVSVGAVFGAIGVALAMSVTYCVQLASITVLYQRLKA